MCDTFLGPFSVCVTQADVTEDRIPHCPVCTGIVKPDVVFFGEALPQRFLLHVLDFPMADLLLILGTSLEVCQQVQWWTDCVCVCVCGGGRLEGQGPGGGAAGGGTRCPRSLLAS